MARDKRYSGSEALSRSFDDAGWIRVGPADEVSGALTVIDIPHSRVHEGEVFKAVFVDADLDSAAVANIRIVAPNTLVRCHVVFMVQSTLGLAWELYRDTTHTVGTGITSYNKEQNSSDSATMTVSHTASGGSDGTQIDAGAFGAKKTGGVDRGDEEWILEQNTVYLLKATSAVNDNKVVLSVLWYEVA